MYVRLVCLLLLLMPNALYAAELNAGIVQGLWYSDASLFADTPVRVYVAIRNTTDTDLSGTVEFFADDNRFGKMSVHALSGRIVEAWADWNPSYGEHTITATLTRLEIGNTSTSSSITASLAESIIFVDYDTDKDHLGNTIDTDDDNDGISDIDEQDLGTDPLIPNKNTATATTSATTSAPQGLEQYLSTSRAETALRTFTSYINNTKEYIETYRTNRTTEQNADATITPLATHTTPVSSETKSADHIGTITRNNTADHWVKDPVATTWQYVQLAATRGYDAILWAIVRILSNPIIVQLVLLLLILIVIFKTAARFAHRQ